MPTAAIGYTFLTTPFWSPLFLVPGAAALGFAVYGFVAANSEKVRDLRLKPAGTRPRRG